MSGRPTLGRVVWYFEEEHEKIEPRTAQVAYVHEDGRINIGYLSKDGEPRNAARVEQATEGDLIENVIGKWCWPVRDENFQIALEQDHLRRKAEQVAKVEEALGNLFPTPPAQPPLAENASDPKPAGGAESFATESDTGESAPPADGVSQEDNDASPKPSALSVERQGSTEVISSAPASSVESALTLESTQTVDSEG